MAQWVRVSDGSVGKRVLVALAEGLIPSTCKKKRCYAHTCNPLLVVETGRCPELTSQPPWLKWQFPGTVRDPVTASSACLEEERQRVTEQDTWHPLYMHRVVHMHIHVHVYLTHKHNIRLLLSLWWLE